MVATIVLFATLIGIFAIVVSVAYRAEERPRPVFREWFLAWFRLDLDMVCKLSHGRTRDFHDYPDDIIGEPWHFGPLTCKRCGKEFYI